MRQTIDFYNSQVEAYASLEDEKPKIENFVSNDDSKISWSSSLLAFCKRGVLSNGFEASLLRQSVYRPFNKQCLFFNYLFNHRPGQMPKLFPTPDAKNLLICVPGAGSKKEFAPFMVSCIPDVQIIQNGQCFPLYYYVPEATETPLFASLDESRYSRRSALTPEIMLEASKRYGSGTTAEDVFYFVYGALHAPDYRERYANDLRKSLPRLPAPSEATFRAFSEAGRRLANLHLNYDGPNVRIVLNGKELEPPRPYPVKIAGAEPGATPEELRVEKMKWAVKGDFTRLIYNSKITISDIPADAEKYVVNGRSPLGWLIDRYQVKTDSASGIVNDPNDWAPENPRYILDLIPRLVAVSVETLKIVKKLPKLLDD